MPIDRKYLLYGALGVTAVLFAGDAAMRRFVSEPLQAAERTQAALQKRLNRRNLEMKQATKTLKQLPDLEQRSLPSNREMARSRYQAWLLDLIEQAGLKGPNVDSGEPQSFKSLYSIFTFNVRGRGTLGQVTQFLHSFYEAGHLHKIKSMTLNPMQNAEQIDLSMTIEALCLKAATRTDELTDVQSESLALASLNDYRSLARRNFFRAGDANSAAMGTVLTAVTSDVRGIREAWFSIKKTGKTLVLREGDRLSLDTLQAQIVEIGDEQVAAELDGQPYTIHIGKSFAEAMAGATTP